MRKSYRLLFAVLGLFLLPGISSAKSGCCSRHGGQAYCGSNGMWQCNDGTQSPSCTCYVAPKVIKKTLTCKSGYVLSSSGKTCIKKLTCKSGYILSSTGKSCIKKK